MPETNDKVGPHDENMHCNYYWTYVCIHNPHVSIIESSDDTYHPPTHGQVEM